MRLCTFLLIVFISTEVTGQDTVKTNYPESTREWIKVYKEGRKIQEKIYYESGQEWMSAEYTADTNEIWKWYYENGNPFFSATIRNDQLQGPYKLWYENGHLAEELTFTDNIENGAATFYYENGMVAATGTYENGRMIGDWKFLNEQGEPADGTWKWRFFALPEKIRMEGTLESGRRTGTWTYTTTAKGPDMKVFREEF